MAAPDSTLAAGLGGYARTFVQWHLWDAVRLGLVPRGEPYAVYCPPRRRQAGDARPAWGTFADFVGRTFGWHSHHVALSPGVRVACTSVTGAGTIIDLVVELADGARTRFQPRMDEYGDSFGVVDLTVNSRTGVLIAATEHLETTGLCIDIAEFAVSPRGCVTRGRCRRWKPRSHSGPAGPAGPPPELLALRASPGGSRLYALTQESLCPPGEGSSLWGRWTVTALAEASLVEECCWEAPRYARSLAVTDIGHLILVGRNWSETEARVYAPMGEVLRVVTSWKISAFYGSETVLYDSDTGRLLVWFEARTRESDPSSSLERVLAVWE
jgi:hypothetical protein